MKFDNVLGAENIMDDYAELRAYSYCSSESEEMPSAVLFPSSTEEAAKILRGCNQSRTPIVIRGSGTSTSNGCIGKNTTILSSERMRKISHLDLRNRCVEVQAGITLYELNTLLLEHNMIFPFTPLNQCMSLGGMMALDSLTRESEHYGRMSLWVEEFEFVDGTGKVFFTDKKELVAGKEGLSGFITRMNLKITEMPTISLDVFSFDDILELLKQARMLKKDRELFSLEFIDRAVAEALGFEKKMMLFAAYSSLKGKHKSLLEIKSILDALNRAYAVARSAGYYYLEDPSVTLEKAYDLIDWCEKNDARIIGHIGQGHFNVLFRKEKRITEFRDFIKHIGGSLGRMQGIGTRNTEFVPSEEKKSLIRLKDEHDYNNVLNPGKMIAYR